MRILSLIIVASTCIGFSNVMAFDVPRASTPVVLDGDPSDPAWDAADWRPMDQVILGMTPSPEDFSGRYRLLWAPDGLYLLAEIHDDVLHDSRADPLFEYWDDDALEIFLDPDASGGDHTFNYNAFAYHVALDNQAVDIGPWASPEDEAAGRPNFRLYPEHVQAQWKRQAEPPHAVIWEARIAVFADDFTDSGPNEEEVLEAGRVMGFMLAYCDADDTSGRQHFVGDVLIEPVNGDTNLGWRDAGVFGQIRLVD